MPSSCVRREGVGVLPASQASLGLLRRDPAGTGQRHPRQSQEESALLGAARHRSRGVSRALTRGGPHRGIEAFHAWPHFWSTCTLETPTLTQKVLRS